MSENGHENGHENGQVRVKFGPGKTQDMPREWAEMILSEWREKQPIQFGKALARVAVKAP